VDLLTRHSLATAVAAVLSLLPVAVSEGQQSPAIPGFSAAHAETERRLEEKFRSIPDAVRAESNLRRLTSEPHMAGTDASRRVAEWLRDQYRSFGFSAEIVSYKVWLPEPRETRLELIAPVAKSLASPEQPFDGDTQTYDPRIGPAFNAYSPSGDVTAAVVYANYGMPDDYRELASMGVSVEGKIVLARYGRGYRGIKPKLAEEHKALGVILYSDPEDDGYAAGDPYPYGPWRPMSGIQRGSVMYTQIYPGDPLTPGIAATASAKRIPAANAANLPRIPTIPINAQDASVILSNLGGAHVPHDWQGGLPFTYHVGPGDARVHMKAAIDYAERPIYDVVATLRGTNDDEWIMLGNHHDAWVFGAADPGSGTSAMLETARALGELAKAGWKPRRTIVICHWDAEEPGLIGSTEWVEEHRTELQAKALVYINTDVGVSGPNFAASATPSLKGLVRDVMRDVEDPDTHGAVYDSWREQAARAARKESGTARQAPSAESSDEPPLTALGAGSDFSPFIDYAGIPAIDLGFGGDYGVYHSIFDDFYWMKHFGDPRFGYHVALAQALGTIALRLDQADVLPFDYSAYATEIEQEAGNLAAIAARRPEEAEGVKALSDAAARLSASAARASQALHAISPAALDTPGAKRINRALVEVEQEFLSPDGLSGRPWFKHTIFAPGSYTGYAAEVMPGVAEALTRHDQATLRHETNAVAAALDRAAIRLEDIARLARQVDAVPAESR
jgi:N-acetylated-alpha-linked acidic dipeptidase